MSAIRSKPGPHRVAFAAMGVCAISLLGAGPTRAAAPIYTDILPLRHIKPGMTGYGLTTFHGTRISRFEVKVIGILRKVNNGHDLILIRMQGGPITERGANLIQGMSGSPIYIDGKCIGAFSQGETWPKEPVGMVTPIEDMLEAWDPDIPQTPPYFQPANFQPANFQPANKNGANSTEKDHNSKSTSNNTSNSRGLQPSPQDRTLAYGGDSRFDVNRFDASERRIALDTPLRVGGRQIRSLVLNARPGTRVTSDASTAVLHRATTYAVVGGVTEKERAWFQKELDRRGYAFTLGQTPVMGAGKTNLPATPLRPGSCFGTFLSSGDVEFGAFGTVTYRKGNRILGFGHPFFGFGALNAAATSASVVDVFSGVQVSHLIAEAGPVVGTITQDRNFSVSVELGRKPVQIPFDITVRDETTHRSQTFHSLLFQHPDLTSALLSLIGKAAISRVHNTPGDVMARVTTSVEAGEVGRVTRSNLLFDADDISGPVVQDLNEINAVVSGNPFYPLPIKRASMTVDLYSGHNTATLERIFLKQGRYEPGDNLEIGVVLKPYRREPIIKTLSLKIPSDTPNGRYILAVRGGPPPVLRMGGFVLGGGADPQPPPANVSQMIARLNSREKSTDMVARLLLNTGAPALEGEKLSQLPPNLAVLMRSDRNSGVRIERDELRSIAHSDYVLNGSQQLYVTVQRKNTQEPGGPLNLNGNGTIIIPGSSSTLPTGNGASTPVGGLNEESVPQNPDTHPLPFTFAPATQRWFDLFKIDATGKSTHNSGMIASQGRDDGTLDAPTEEPLRQSGAGNIVRENNTRESNTDSELIRVVGRQLQTWRQSGAAGFNTGKFTGTSVAATGELRLAPRLRRLVSSNETYLWSLVSDAQGNLYAGTGTTGKILKIDTTGKLTIFAQLPVVAIQSLLLAHDGTFWAGSSVQGKLFHIRQDGTVTHVATLPERYLVALCEDSKGNLYVGAGAGGKIYKVAAGYQPKDPERTDALPVFVTTGGDYVTSMTIDPQDNLYIGTGNEGILYHVTPNGHSTVLYDAKENSITALALDNTGNIYAGTGPRGLLYRIAPDGSATVIYDRASSFYTGIRLAHDGTLYATTVNAAYHIYPAQTASAQIAASQINSSQINSYGPVLVQPLDNPREVDFLTLTLLPNDSVAIGTGNIGEIYTSQPEANRQAEANSNVPTSGIFESVIHDNKLISRWGTIHTVAILPNGAKLEVATRTGNVAEPDSTWSNWETPLMLGQKEEQREGLREGLREGRIMSPPARFIQYRLALTASSSQDRAKMNDLTPSVREVSISYLPRNQAPKVSFLAPQGGERWAKTQNIRWLGSDPDSDTLTYELFYSVDGTTWHPIPSNLRATDSKSPDSKGSDSKGSDSKGSDSSSTTSGGSQSANGNTGVRSGVNALEQVQNALAAQPNLPDAIKQQVLESARQRQQARAALVVAGPEETGSAAAPHNTQSQRDTSRSFDTHTLPDGAYWLKVVASDVASNPADPQTAQAISEPFMIVNALPTLALTGKPTAGADRRVTVNGTASQKLIAITGVQYRVDGGDWLSAISKDGLFDSTEERFALTTGPLAAGKHNIEIAAFNAANNRVVQKVEAVVE